MIPASQPVTVPASAEVTYDQWTPLEIRITRTGPGASRVSVVAQRSRIVNDAGDTELCPTAPPVEVVVPNLYMPATDGIAGMGHVYPTAVRAKTLAAAGPLLEAVAALLDARSIR